jgi:hypothetical protein
VPLTATKNSASCKNQSANKTAGAGCCVDILYASKVQETADGSGRSARRETRIEENIVA